MISYLYNDTAAGFYLKLLLQNRPVRTAVTFCAAFEQEAVFPFFIHGPAIQRPFLHSDGKAGLGVRKSPFRNGTGNVIMDKGSKQQALFLTEAVVKFFLQCQFDTYLSQSQNVQEMQHVTIAWQPQRMWAEV